ncbi:MAG: Cold-shock DNA-binding domain protein, partial [Polaromonas sp.]|nr:Cold-shock DNA-binding domain protein [Polaromonas sp.]
MKKQGKVARWDSVRAFGFIRSQDTPADIFFHIKDFRGAAVPQEGMPVTFEEIHVGGKGPRAMSVHTGMFLQDAPGGATARAAMAPSQARSRATTRSPRHRTLNRTAASRPAAPALLLMLGWAVL